MDYLDMEESNLTGTIPSELGNWYQLTRLYAEFNEMIGTLPSELFRLGRLRQLWLLGNELTGTIPAEIGLLTELETLDLNENSLSGPIPANLTMRTNMQYLRLMNTTISGSLPSEIGLLIELRPRLHVALNRLTSIIPSELGMCQVTTMFLDSNYMVGSLPSELATPTLLKSFRLNENSLTGTVPSKYQYSASLTDLRSQLTGVSGDLDSMLSNDRDPVTTFASDCLGPDPEVLCSCCETCCDVSSVWCTGDDVCVNATNQQP
jgi:Leucine-rich repeat (LRR) protein